LLSVPAAHFSQDPVLFVKLPNPQVGAFSLTHSLFLVLPRGLLVFGGHLPVTGLAEFEPSSHQ